MTRSDLLRQSMIALPRSPNKPQLAGTSAGLIDWILKKRRPMAVKNPRGRVALADLFSGCGGLTLGAIEAIRRHDLVADIKLAIDTDPECVGVYSRNFDISADRLVCGSITDLVPGELGAPLDDTEQALKRHIGNLDLVVAGPPCQGHSDLNNHSRRDDPKNRLYLRAIRFVEIVLPQVVIIENVPAAQHDKSKVVQHAMEFLEKKLGYNVRFETISAHRFGLPQLRKRLVLLAVKKKDPMPLFETYRGLSTKHNLRSLIGDLVDEPKGRTDIYCTPSWMTETNMRRVEYLFKEKKYDLPNSRRPACHRDKDHSYKSMYGRLRWDRLAQTITGGFGSMGQGRYVHPARKRVITPHEAARIQGFPDYFDFGSVGKRTILHQMIGNAVPPVMAFRPIFDMLTHGYLLASH